MKFMHIADVHLGADPDPGVLRDIDRKQEIWNTFRRTLEEARNLGVELLLIAGDLFHRQPLVRELREVNYLLSEVYGGRTVLIAGNHDYLKHDSNYLTFPWDPKITLLVGDSESPVVDRVIYEDWNLSVEGFSYRTREITKPLYEGLTPEDDGRIHILLAHGGDEKHIPMSLRGLSALPYEYVALGHIHKPGELVKDKVIFPGSLEPTDHNDVGERGCVVGELDETGVRVSFVPMATRRYIHLDALVTEETTENSLRDYMCARMYEEGPEHLYKWRLTGMRHPEFTIDTANLCPEGHIISITDETRPALRLEELQRLHAGDIIGMYIDSFLGGERTREMLSPTEQAALYEGVLTLQGYR